MTNIVPIANAGVVPRQIGEPRQTPTERDIRRSLDLVWDTEGPAMTMISGAPGVGKTRALVNFCDRLGYDAIYIAAARGEGTAWNFARSLMGIWTPSKFPFNSISEARQTLAFNYIGQRRFLIVDEAQYLRQSDRRTGDHLQAVEWLRALAETGGFKLALCGDLGLSDMICQIPQLQSRMVRPVVIDAVRREDVAAIVAETAYDKPEIIDALHCVARLHGGLRNVQNVLRIAELFAGDDAPTTDHVRAAIIDMKLAPKGGAK